MSRLKVYRSRVGATGLQSLGYRLEVGAPIATSEKPHRLAAGLDGQSPHEGAVRVDAEKTTSPARPPGFVEREPNDVR